MSSVLTLLDVPTTLTGLLTERATERAEQVAFRYSGDNGQQIPWTYRELDQRARAIGATLREKYQPGERVLLVYPAGLEFIAGFFGTLYAGLLPVPATYPKPRRPLPRLDAIAEDCSPRAALTTADTLDLLKLDEQSPKVRDLDWFATDALPVASDDALIHSFEPSAVDPADAAFLQYTSGSTSQPRGVVVSHGNILHNLSAICQGFGFDPQNFDNEDLAQPMEGAFWLPAYHDMGLIGGVLTPIYVGGTSFLMAPATFLRSPITWLETMSRTGASISGAPNFAYDLCVDKTTPEQRVGLDLSKWEIAFCGAEPVDAGTLQRFSAAFAPHGFRSSAFYPCYGLAESTLMVTGGYHDREPRIIDVDREQLTLKKVVPIEVNGIATPAAQIKTLVSCGRVLGDQDVRIVDPMTRQTCQMGEIGEVWIRGGSVASGYWGQDSADCPTFAALLANGSDDENSPVGNGLFMRTGDLGFMDDRSLNSDNLDESSNEPELFVTGRTKDVIIIRGRNHYPQDIERSGHQAHEAVDLGAAFGLDASGKEQLVVVHQVHREHRRGNLEEVLQAVRAAIVEQHEIDPQAIVLIKPASLPLTTSGKVQRSRCREMYLADELNVLSKWRQREVEATAGKDAEPQGSPGAEAPEPDFLDDVQSLELPELAKRVEAWMLALLATKVETTGAAISGETPFAELGIDSMTSIELSMEFERALNLQLPPAAAWSHPSPATLSHFLAEQLQAAKVTSADLPTSAR